VNENVDLESSHRYSRHTRVSRSSSEFPTCRLHRPKSLPPIGRRCLSGHVTPAASRRDVAVAAIDRSATRETVATNWRLPTVGQISVTICLLRYMCLCVTRLCVFTQTCAYNKDQGFKPSRLAHCSVARDFCYRPMFVQYVFRSLSDDVTLTI